jgi:hypothetical protein
VRSSTSSGADEEDARTVARAASVRSRHPNGHSRPPPSGGYVVADVADEPTGRLDEELSTHVLTTLREVCAAAGTGVLLASHDPVVVAAADRVVRLSDGLVVED